MALDDIYAKPLRLEELQQYKALTPLFETALKELAGIEALDVTGYYEQEVRAFVIDPIIRVLGYGKGTDFSLDLGRPLEFLGKKKFPDYKFHLWQENFWLIEAKRPLPENAGNFGYDALAQAVEYAAHPEINAALVVLCDGLILEVFDREVSLTAPILHVDQKNLRADFDKIRRLLDPMQNWFFQKRRVVRLIDKVLDKEFNFERVEEFRALVERRIIGKRAAAIENLRRNVKPDHEERRRQILVAPLEQLEAEMFFEQPLPITNALIDALVSKSSPSSFQPMARIFGDRPRDANDVFMAHGLAYLIALHERAVPVYWLPGWLGHAGPTNVRAAAEYMLEQCLSYFAKDEPRRTVLLAAATFRRIFKLLCVTSEAQWQHGELLHFLQRYHADELSWGQIISTPKGHLVGMMESQALAATQHFVARCHGERGEFKPETAKWQLRTLWAFEVKFLAANPGYPKLLAEANLGTGRVTECASTTYDVLGHTTLCILHPFPQWTAYALQAHRPMVEALAAMNSWKAQELLGLKNDANVKRLSDEDLARRFFYGDVSVLSALRKGYNIVV